MKDRLKIRCEINVAKHTFDLSEMEKFVRGRKHRIYGIYNEKARTL